MAVVKTRLSPVARSNGPPGRDTFLPAGARAIADLTVMGCRWPTGEIVDDDFRFCGRLRNRVSYCPAHHRLAYAGGAQ